MPTKRSAIPFVGTLALVLILAGCGSNDHGASTMAKDLSSAGLDFSTLHEAKNIDCTYTGLNQQAVSPTYSCKWLQGEKEQSGKWELDEGKPARLSEGGESTGPPANEEEASSLVSAVYKERASGSAKCFKRESETIEGHKIELANTWSCLLMNSLGDAVSPGGEPLHEKWVWNPDGSVSSEQLDLSSSGQEPEGSGTANPTGPATEQNGPGSNCQYDENIC